MEADDKTGLEDKVYQSCTNTCNSSVHNVEDSHNSNHDKRRAGIMWSSVFCAQDRENKLSYQCPSPSRSSTGSLACSVDDCTTTSDLGDLDELGDLLRRFDTFFREKVDAELQSVREFMHGMLSEQQIHLQQILSSRLHQKTCPQHAGPHPPGEDDAFQDHKVPDTPEETSVHMSTSADESLSEVYNKSATKDILLDLMALSCELSAVLSQAKYM